MTNEIVTKLVIDLSKKEGHPDRVQSIPLTAEELEQRELDRIAAEAAEAERLIAEQAQADAKASAEAKLTALGLTAEEIAALKG
jgi:hypothetical protein